MSTLLLRLLLIFGSIASIEILVILFAGTSYFLLVFALLLILLNAAPYSDLISVALVGKEYYSKQADTIARLRKDKGILIIGIPLSVIFLGASIFLILRGNVRLIDYIW